MKKIKWIGLFFCLTASLVRAQVGDTMRQALQQAVDEAKASMQAAGLPAENVSLLPIQGDQNGYVKGLLKNAATAAGLSYVEHGGDPLWDAILSEIEWDERKGDMLDQSTLVKFGQLQGTQLLLYGNLREVSQTASRVFVEIELHLTSVTTKQHLWGGIFARRYYLPGARQGIVDLDPEVRKTIREAFEGASASINSSPKLGAVSSVVMVPLAGDIDGYVTTLAENMLSGTKLNPKEADVLTLGEARVLLRDKPETADAVLFGAVRDLSRELKHEEAMRDVYEINTEVQLTLQSARTGDVLWSRTLSAEGIDEETMTGKEAAYQVVKNKPNVLLIAAGVIVGLLLLGMFFKAVSRPR